MTGRGAGYCAGYTVPGFSNPIYGRGFGAGWGRGASRGRRNRFYATGIPGWQRAAMGWPFYASYPPAYDSPFVSAITKEQQIDALKNQAEYFKNAMDDIRRRIEELEAKTKDA
jgi:hypothetical protein